MKLIEKEKLIEIIMKSPVWTGLDAIARINAMPAIDIVRCKECKHRKKNGFCLEHNRYEKNDKGYCSYGEREGE